MTGWARWWWLLPARLTRRLSGGLALALVDGAALLAWPGIAVLAAPAALLTGLLFGWLHPGYDEVYTESLVFLLLAAAVGTLAGHLGALLTIGYAAGDFLLWHDRWIGDYGLAHHLTRERLPLLIGYALLWLLTVRTPLLAKGIAGQLALPARIDRRLRFAVAAAAHLLTTAALVWLWAAATPLLIRPLFTWTGREPTVEAITPLQREAGALVLVALLAAAARLTVQHRTAVVPALADRIDRVADALTPARPIRPLLERAPLLAVLAGTAGSLLVLAALAATVADAIALAAALAAVAAARAGILPVPLGRWPDLAARIPLLARLAAGLLAVNWVAQTVVAPRYQTAETFRPVLIATILALIVLYLLNPPPARRPGQGRG